MGDGKTGFQRADWAGGWAWWVRIGSVSDAGRARCWVAQIGAEARIGGRPSQNRRWGARTQRVPPVMEAGGSQYGPGANESRAAIRSAGRCDEVGVPTFATRQGGGRRK